MSGQIILWQVGSAYGFALIGGVIGALLRLAHKPLCALISFAAGTLLGVTLFAIVPESLGNSNWWAAALAAATGYALFFFISKYVHHVCPACAASHFDEDTTRHFSQIATALIIALAIHSTTDGLALGILLPSRRFALLARPDHGARRRRIFVSGCPRDSGRIGKARENDSSDEFLCWSGADWDPQHLLEGARA